MRVIAAAVIVLSGSIMCSFAALTAALALGHPRTSEASTIAMTVGVLVIVFGAGMICAEYYFDRPKLSRESGGQSP